MVGKSERIDNDKLRQQALGTAIQQIEKQYGKGSIMKLGSEGAHLQIEGIRTGSLALDEALGGLGVPRGRIVEIYGPESSGKTTLSLHIAANAQKLGGIAAFIDAEHALDPVYSRKLGVDVDNMLVSQPDTGEQALEIAEMLVRSNAVDVVVIDSVAALVPRAEIEGEMGDAHVGLQARLMSQALRKLTAAIARSRTCMIFINQIREKIGVMFGSPETTSGGRALKFYASVRIDIRRIGSIKDSEQAVGNRVRATVAKNKIAAPFKRAEFDIMFSEGISQIGELIDLGVEHRVIEKSGAWFSYGDIRLGQGKENSRTFIRENPDLLEELDTKVRLAMGLLKPEETGEEAAAAATESAAKTTDSAAENSAATDSAAENSAAENSAAENSAAENASSNGEPAKAGSAKKRTRSKEQTAG